MSNREPLGVFKAFDEDGNINAEALAEAIRESARSKFASEEEDSE